MRIYPFPAKTKAHNFIFMEFQCNLSWEGIRIKSEWEWVVNANEFTFIMSAKNDRGIIIINYPGIIILIICYYSNRRITRVSMDGECVAAGRTWLIGWPPLGWKRNNDTITIPLNESFSSWWRCAIFRWPNQTVSLVVKWFVGFSSGHFSMSHTNLIYQDLVVVLFHRQSKWQVLLIVLAGIRRQRKGYISISLKRICVWLVVSVQCRGQGPGSQLLVLDRDGGHKLLKVSRPDGPSIWGNCKFPCSTRRLLSHAGPVPPPHHLISTWHWKRGIRRRRSDIGRKRTVTAYN